MDKEDFIELLIRIVGSVVIIWDKARNKFIEVSMERKPQKRI